MAPLGKPRRRVVVEPLRETRPTREPRETPVKPKRREKVPAR